MFAAALFAVVGHVFPVWLRLRGGKGVATGLGSFAILTPKTILVVIAVFIFILLRVSLRFDCLDPQRGSVPAPGLDSRARDRIRGWSES